MNLDVVRSLLAEPGKSQAPEVFMMMMIPVVLGIALFGFGMSREKEAGSPYVKFLSVIPVAIAAWLGYPYFDYATDKFNKATNVIGGRSEQMYWISFWLPVILLVVLIAFFIFEQIRSKDATEEF